VQLPVRDQVGIPQRVHVAGEARAVRIAAVRRPEHRHANAVAAAFDAERVKRLVQITDQVDEELQRNRAVGAIQRTVAEAFLVVADAIDDAVAPLSPRPPAATPGCRGQSRSRS
jgi:hypothetical protein